jgi:hypothetical protein
LVPTEDKMIGRLLGAKWQRAPARLSRELPATDIYISKPEVVAALIAKAAKSVSCKMAVNY